METLKVITQSVSRNDLNYTKTQWRDVTWRDVVTTGNPSGERPCYERTWFSSIAPGKSFIQVATSTLFSTTNVITIERAADEAFLINQETKWYKEEAGSLNKGVCCTGRVHVRGLCRRKLSMCTTWRRMAGVKVHISSSNLNARRRRVSASRPGRYTNEQKAVLNNLDTKQLM